MSGPKISNYDLSPEARKNLNDQILCERKSILCAAEIRRLMMQLLDCREAAKTELEQLQLLQQYSDKNSLRPDILADLLARFESDSARFAIQLQSENPVLSTSYNLTDAELKKKKEQLKRLREMKQALLASARPLQDYLAQHRDEKELRSQLKNAIVSELSTDVSFDISVKTSEDILAQKKQEISARLEKLLSDDECPPSVKSSLQSAVRALERIHTADHLASFCSITADPLEKRFQKEKEKIAARKAKLEELTEQYIMLGELTGIMTQAVPTDIDFLKEKIAEMEQQMIRAREQEYIAGCIDEVMVEMGYDLIGHREVTKKSGKHFRNELYTFDDGIAVNVTYSSDGQIAMELGGLADEDRIPTAEEVDILVEEMEEFCTDFEEIERRLSDKGVVLKSRIVLAPPTAEHAAIINSGEYEIVKGKSASGMRTAGRRKGVAGKARHRRDDE